MTKRPAPQPTDLTKPFWQSLQSGQLTYLSCKKCNHNFLPAREDCPDCLAPNPEWRLASGRAKLISWVEYHRAFHSGFVDLLPYIVALVELDEGPRMITNIINYDDSSKLRIEAPLKLKIKEINSDYIPNFTLE